MRDLYEIRERPSKIYHWLSFLFAAILAEIPWNLLVGTLFFFGWYFPVGKIPLPLHLIARVLEGCQYSGGSCCFPVAIPDGVGVIRQHICSVYLFICITLCLALLIADAESTHRGNDYIVNVFIDIDICWCLPAFGKFDWILALDVFSFLVQLTSRYWLSPIQYMISATVSNALHGIQVTCTPEELSIIQPPSGTYLTDLSSDS